MSRVVLVLCLLTVLVRSEFLFEEGFVKFTRHGKRQIFKNVTSFDEKTVGKNRNFLMVKARNLEVLYEKSVRSLKSLRELFLVKSGIRKIEPRAFYDLPNLSVLHLEDNSIRKLEKGVFNNLPVKILSLHRNQIREIASEAFDNLPNLVKIKLNKNQLKIWDSNWFKHSPKLTDLYFRRNRINHLPISAFRNIKSQEAKIFLSKNKLGSLQKDSFSGLQILSQLYLDRNNLTQLPVGVFADLRRIDVLYLARNKFEQVREDVFNKKVQIGILDLSSNFLECVSYNLVVLANVTILDKNEKACECREKLNERLRNERINKEVVIDDDTCEDLEN